MANLSNTQYNVELEDIKNEYATQRDSLRTNVTNISAQENALMTDVNTVDEQRIKAEASNVRAQAEAERNRKRYGIQLTGAEQS
jgi:outer membrane murein-binding lipoprotein Lpp